MWMVVSTGSVLCGRIIIGSVFSQNPPHVFLCFFPHRVPLSYHVLIVCCVPVVISGFCAVHKSHNVSAVFLVNVAGVRIRCSPHELSIFLFIIWICMHHGGHDDTCGHDIQMTILTCMAKVDCGDSEYSHIPKHCPTTSLLCAKKMTPVPKY